MSERLRDFCINESNRVARFAAKLEEYGHRQRAAEMREIAARFDAMAKDEAA